MQCDIKICEILIKRSLKQIMLIKKRSAYEIRKPS